MINLKMANAASSKIKFFSKLFFKNPYQTRNAVYVEDNEVKGMYGVGISKIMEDKRRRDCKLMHFPYTGTQLKNGR